MNTTTSYQPGVLYPVGEWHNDEKLMTDKEREEAANYANVIISKIRKRLETDVYIYTVSGMTDVFAVFGTSKRTRMNQLFSVAPGNILLRNNSAIYTRSNDENVPPVSEEEIIEESVGTITSDKEYTNRLILERLGELNRNFSRLFDFLKESVELVPGNDEVTK
ncbi:hypothetical protein [Brazilian marseillevirus]|uniref:hypothetical protein n=1 Tax=Brazilian marseillevirus TaxID=1813599 RepID=UPI000781226F|nr:hypothetical protein A3303_gp488 [Brazilian marseillevirus]AMQ10996.1 hypothetical protein [Brazilian marseillevirus]